MTDNADFTIVGAGLGGALLACYLGRAGYRVDVYEKRPDPRLHGAERGRSINLALSIRGIEALRAVGLAEEVLRNAIPMRGRMIHPQAGALRFQPYGKDETQAIHSVSRAGLNLTLVHAAAACPSVRLFFGNRCTRVDVDAPALDMVDEATQETRRVACATVVGADGAYSAVRWQMQKHGRFNYEQAYLSHGYKELSMPAGPGGRFLLEKNALHIWPRRSFMMIALPNLDGSFTCTLFLAFEGRDSFARVRTRGEVQQFFLEEFPDAVPLLPDLGEEFVYNPTGPLVTIRCDPWHVADRVSLIGDAAHAVVPFLGQGMNAAFEDCTVLTQCLSRHVSNRQAALASFEQQRKENVDVLADLCIDNFIEMRDRVSSRLFLLRKKCEILLHRLFPRWFVPLYTLVTFTTTPYAAARRRTTIQTWVVRGIVAGLLVLLLGLAFWIARF